MARTIALGVCLAALPTPPARGQEAAVQPPPGFSRLFTGKDLAGWHGMPHVDPRELAKMPDAERAQKIAEWTADATKHWSAQNGELVNDGHGAYLTTDKEYGDYELLLEYKTVAKADSGIYLRATPQVQIWDTTQEGGKWNIGADKGSGGLWNNSPGAPGKDPLVLADKPFGEWNSVKVIQVGARTTVYLNDKLVVDHAIMENFWDRAAPLFAKGPIQLQTHGGEIRWRNVFIREIPAAEANALLAAQGEAGFAPVFDGTSLAGWAGATDNYEVVDGVIRCKPGKGGTLHTKDEYADFVARLEFRLPPGGNNGLAIRYPGQGDTAYTGMCELQVLDNDSPKYAALDARQYHGSAYGMAAAKRGYLRPAGEWNFQEVTVTGPRIKVELNGSVILDADLSKVTEFMANTPHPGKNRTSGFFGFAGHGDAVEFRNVRLKRLGAAPAPANGAATGTAAPPRLVCACAADNDLFVALGKSGYVVGRADDAAAAVAAAPAGAGVLVLADQYPASGPTITSDLLAAAAAKKLKVFVEYPAALPGLELAKPRAAGAERAVVADDFFGAALPAGRILAVQGMHFVPVAAAKPHLVAARVAGFDTAVFGLPESTHPLLFEIEPAGGPPVLVATTAFSRFVRGRYAPADAWRATFEAVLRWLDPAGPAHRFEWTPVVRPSYAKDAPLPADAERQAVRRGAEWFITSKLLLPRERLAEVEKGGDARMPTPPPDAPVGDGSLGILEAPVSVIGPDGRQLQSTARRGDCHGESAMALALAAKLLDDPAKATIARNLVDYYLFTSDAQKKERGDPNHGAYGLVAWGISTPAWYVGNYGDDNAKMMLGMLATAAVLGENRWNESLAKCLLANLRTTGRLGFRGDRLDVPGLGEKGWRYFFDRASVNMAPHFEAYPWACFLAANRASGFDLFRKRGERPIRQTMAAYTDGWRWTNGIAQEKARMLLPLAWLVRLDGSPENRALLRKAVEGVVALQDSSGAIREELGLPGRGMFPPPASNETYGHHEASLIQANGDPVADLLYTSNFAFIGLHEAAAAGDEVAAAAADKLAEFMCRIQVKSDTDPSIDGGWFRAFDFGRWEAWGSNADAGWGAWAIESGWTQGWIVAVLAMRELDTSLWDLAAQVDIGPEINRLRPTMIPDDALLAVSEGPPVAHAAKGKTVALATKPSLMYLAGDLLDGQLGKPDHAGPAWLGFENTGLDATIDMGTPTRIESVTAHLLGNHRVGIALPKQIEVWVGDDPARLVSIGTVVPTAAAAEPAITTVEVRPAQPVTGRYVRLRAEPVNQWTFVSEVLVNPPADFVRGQ